MSQTTIIDAIVNLVNNPIITLGREYRSRNRANSMGEALEEYVKDLFAGTFKCEPQERYDRFERVFSYIGNNSNPPDAMLRGGDAIEVKKIESLDASLALNSSYPKHMLRADSPMISDACRNAEQWTEKDMLYVVGVVQNSMLRHLAMVYGLDYCASENCYRGLKTRIAQGVNAIEGVEFAQTRELGRINRVDPPGHHVHAGSGDVGHREPMVGIRLCLSAGHAQTAEFHVSRQPRKVGAHSGSRKTARSRTSKPAPDAFGCTSQESRQSGQAQRCRADFILGIATYFLFCMAMAATAF